MLRKLYISCLILVATFSFSNANAQRGKSEVAFGYGYFSHYSFINHSENSVPVSTSSGAFALNYRYYLSRQVTLGMGLAYENTTNWGSFFTIAPEVTVAYMDTRDDYVRVRLYGAVSAGLTVFSETNIDTKHGEIDESGLKAWAFQATPFGMRIGRQFAGFVELGVGYKGIIHGGMELRFPRYFHTHEHEPAN